MPDERELTAYAAVAPSLGVPAPYYADRLIGPDTWSAVAAAWAAYREAHAAPHKLGSHGGQA